MSQLTLLTVIAPSIKNRCRKQTSSVPSAYGPFLPSLSRGVLWLCCPQVPKRGGNWTQALGSARAGFALSTADLGAGADCRSQTSARAVTAAALGHRSGPSHKSWFEQWSWRTLMCLGPVFPFFHKIPFSLISAEGRWETFASPSPLSAPSRCKTPAAAFKIYFYACLWAWLGNSSRRGTLTFLTSPPEQPLSLTKKFRHLHSFSISTSARSSRK